MRVVSYSEVLSSFEMTLIISFFCCMDVSEHSLLPYVVIYYTHSYLPCECQKIVFSQTFDWLLVIFEDSCIFNDNF